MGGRISAGRVAELTAALVAVPSFERERDVQELIAAVLDYEPPPISTLQPLLPPAIDHVVRRFLAKDPDERWQHLAPPLVSQQRPTGRIERERQRLEVANDLVNVFHHTGNRLLLMHHAVDAEAPHGRAAKG